AGMKTNVVSREETQVVPSLKPAATEPVTPPTGQAGPASHRRRLMIAAGALGLILVISVGAWRIGSSRDTAPLPVPMKSSSSDRPLFSGVTTAGWINNYGNWVAARDAEGAYVLAGTDGEAIRPLPLKRGPEG